MPARLSACAGEVLASDQLGMDSLHYHQSHCDRCHIAHATHLNARLSLRVHCACSMVADHLPATDNTDQSPDREQLVQLLLQLARSGVVHALMAVQANILSTHRQGIFSIPVTDVGGLAVVWARLLCCASD